MSEHKDDAPKRKQKYVNRQGLRQAIIDNEAIRNTPLYKLPAELATEFEVNLATVHQLRHRLKARASSTPERSGNTATRIMAETTHEGLQRILETEPLINPLDRLKILSRLIRTGPPAVKISAIKTFEEITRETTDRVGPPTPLNDDEAATRLARLLLAIGQPITDKARALAFGDGSETPEVGPEAPLRPEPGQVPLVTPTAVSQVRDMRGADGPLSEPPGGPRPLDGPDPGPPVPSLQPGPGPLPGSDPGPPPSDPLPGG